MAQGTGNKAAEAQELLTMKITIGNKTFIAKLYDNVTTKALTARLPMTVEMSELNRKEKYFNLLKALPVDSAEQPSTIHAGEFMCWSSNCLVLFYTTFKNSYSGYVKLGFIEDNAGLTAALGTESVQVTFSETD